MRFVIVGAGAVGGVLGARLLQGGHDVVFVARGAHLDAITAHGLRVDSPAGTDVIAAPAVVHPRAIDWRPGDVVLLCVKSQHTAEALADVAVAGADPSTPVVCVQNGVANEPHALRRFANVYGATVMCPTAFLEPGVVLAYSAPTTGVIDIGRYPSGVDAVADETSAALAGSTFSSQPVADIRRWKYRKLITNLGNAVEAVCGPSARQGPIGAMVTDEGEQVLAAAGIDVVTRAEDAARRDGWIQRDAVAGVERPGGSSWQSLQRASGTIETAYLNGEIVLLGRMHQVATPVNALLVRLADRMAGGRAAPGSVGEHAFVSLLEAVDHRATPRS